MSLVDNNNDVHGLNSATKTSVRTAAGHASSLCGTHGRAPCTALPHGHCFSWSFFLSRSPSLVVSVSCGLSPGYPFLRLPFLTVDTSRDSICPAVGMVAEQAARTAVLFCVGTARSLVRPPSHTASFSHALAPAHFLSRGLPFARPTLVQPTHRVLKRGTNSSLSHDLPLRFKSNAPPSFPPGRATQAEYHAPLVRLIAWRALFVGIATSTDCSDASVSLSAATGVLAYAASRVYARFHHDVHPRSLNERVM
ncbi:hypothetical protein DFH11DRAFT_1726663 [Phellopilus nigrolimitatus]|nr:hypothetical protein DFH11DRAFT_1726663 [Phellopilus nigrolimitatus]